MKIEKILNNNFVIVVSKSGQEQIVGGKGIAFGKKVGEQIEDDAINQIFKMAIADNQFEFETYINNIPIECLVLGRRIIDLAATRLGKNLNPNSVFSLSDHIHSTSERYKSGVSIPNFTVWEMKRFYPAEFEIGLEAVSIINQEVGVELNDDEAAFIATHIIDSELEVSNLDVVFKITQIIKDVSNIVKYNFNVEFDTDSIYYYRFITHLKFFAQRLLEDINLDNGDLTLYEFIKTRYHNSFDCTRKIGEYLLENYQYTLSNEEKIYLAIHIENVIYKSKKTPK